MSLAILNLMQALTGSHFLGGSELAGTRMSPFWILLELRMMEMVSGDNWSCKTCKSPVKLTPSTTNFLQAE